MLSSVFHDTAWAVIPLSNNGVKQASSEPHLIPKEVLE